jgi:hypothetical protein
LGRPPQIIKTLLQRAASFMRKALFLAAAALVDGAKLYSDRLPRVELTHSPRRLGMTGICAGTKPLAVGVALGASGG